MYANNIQLLHGCVSSTVDLSPPVRTVLLALAALTKARGTLLHREASSYFMKNITGLVYNLAQPVLVKGLLGLVP